MRKVSIIIPCKEIDSMTDKCIKGCLNLDYKNFEIMVLPDKSDKEISRKYKNKIIKIIETGAVKPAFKRNIGMKKAKGEFFGFIDSDAYPEKDWLKNSIKYFNNPKIGIVGGPNLTPKEGNFWEKVSGYVLSNFWSAGFANIRYKIAKNRFVRELPSCNYISRKQASSEYDPEFLTAEDSEFCFTCSKKGYKVLYAGDVIVYHHRRDTLKGHVKQMFIYGRDIAWLSKKDFSFDKVYHSILGIFVILFIEGVFISIFNSLFRNIFLILILIYLLIILLTSMHENLKMTVMVTSTTILTHFSHGIGWLYGIFTKKELSPVKNKF